MPPKILVTGMTANDPERNWVAARVGDAGVMAPQEIGTLAYYCDCEMLDKFSDRGRVIPLIDAQIQQSGPIARALLKVNYLWLDRT